MTKRIRYLTISDIHLGNKKNTTEEIRNNLETFLFKANDFSNLDIIFIAGDLFDDLLDLSSEDVLIALGFISNLMTFCGKNNIKLRVLKGTPSHDWDQCAVTRTIFEMNRKFFELDFAYIDVLHIEYMKDLQLHILYVPDEWSNSAAETYKQVQTLLTENNISQVDIAIMHGMFAYQIPVLIGHAQKHIEQDYLNIVKHFINIGHIHTFSVYKRIIAQGSFDRLAHGEEEAKGGVVCEIRNGEDLFYFIENKTAKIYKTITLVNSDLEKSITKIEKTLSKIPINSHIRIKAKKTHPVYVAFDEVKIQFPMYYFTKNSVEDDEEQKLLNNSVKEDNSFIPFSITRENYKELLLREISAKYSFDNKQLFILNTTLDSMQT